MISEEEKNILEHISRKLLIKKSELYMLTKNSGNGTLDKSLEFLKNSGYIDVLSPIGETSLAITQKGMRALSGR